MATRDLGDVAVKALTRPGVGSALLAALGVILVLILRGVLSALAFSLGGYSGGVSQYLSTALPGVILDGAWRLLPLTIGVFLAFWQIAPIAPQLRMAHVVTRALLAAVIGAVLSGIVQFVGNVGLDVSLAPTLYPSFSGALGSLYYSFSTSFSLLLDALITVPLAALLLWGWLQSHPPKTTARGALDEV